jgi:nucleoside-diphosphate-sugar epimerase
MKVCLLGSNGVLATSTGIWCNKNKIDINVYGRNRPKLYRCNLFHEIDLNNGLIDCKELTSSDIVIFAAGAGIHTKLNETPESIYNMNVFVPIRICLGLNRNEFKGTFISFGSYFEIGANSQQHPFTEEEIAKSFLAVPSNYCISKRMFTRFVSSFNPSFRILHFILPTIYGENEASERLIPYIVKNVLDEKELQFTDGEQLRQYVYVDDVIEIIFAAYKALLSSGIYNIPGTELLTVKNVVELILSGLKTKSKPDFGSASRPDTAMKFLELDGSRLFNTTGLKPTTIIQDVLDRYISRYKP